MKPINITLFQIGVVLFLVFSCRDNNETSAKIDDKVLHIQSLSYTGCKQSLKSTETKEYIEYQTVDSNYLFIKHVNVSLNCCPDSVKIASGIKDGKIQYSVFEKDPKCNCNCFYDINFKIGPLAYTNYDIVANVSTGTSVKFSINFNKHTQGKYEINN